MITGEVQKMQIMATNYDVNHVVPENRPTEVYLQRKQQKFRKLSRDEKPIDRRQKCSSSLAG